jgi:hypothetical protein
MTKSEWKRIYRIERAAKKHGFSKGGGNYTPTLKQLKAVGASSADISAIRKARSPKWGKLPNPSRIGHKVKGGRAVTLHNFTGSIIRKSNGQVVIKGRGKKKQ